MVKALESELVESSGLHGLWLRFGPDALEAEYLRYHDREKVWLVVNTFSVGLVIYLALLVAERNRILAHLPERLGYLLVGAVLANAVVPLGARYVSALRHRLHLLIPLILGINSVLHVCAIALLPAYGAKFPYSLLLIELSFILLLSGVLLRYAVPLGALFVLACSTVDYFIASEDLYFEHVFVLLANLMLGSIACYVLERSERLAWFAARRMREMAEHDQLTGLYNRRYLDQRGGLLVRQSQREQKPVAVLFVDVDWFKTYNDSLGHPQGDDALRRVGEALNNAARRPLDMACRSGGEEFALLLYDCELGAALNRAEELRRHIIALQITHPRSPLSRLTVSIGVAVAPPCQDLTSLLATADQALYTAKHEGRNCVRAMPVAAIQAA